MPERIPPGERLLHELAAAVLDGAEVDWATAEWQADVAARPLVRHLQLVASVARLHRDVLPTATGPAPPSAPQAAVPADEWGHLRLLERVGRGTFGDVFRAWDTRLDREVALKLLPAPPSSDPHALNSIIREGRLLAKVRHPNVVTIHGAEQIGDRIGLWMEFVRGQTLEQLLARGTAFSSADVIGVGVELCRAVAAVHAAGVLHRDIKAHNVTRAEDGRVVLMDFGTGKELADSSSSDLTGTPLYLAPEILAGGPATVQSDVYSLGVLLYRLATGAYPIRGRTILDVRRAHDRNERIAVRTVRPDVGPALARVIERASDPQPERRYENVEAIARELVAAQHRPRMMRLWYGVAAAAAVLVVALVASEVRARQVGDDRSLGQRLISAIAGAPTAVDRPVIAVLPFKNLGGTPEDDLVDSLTVGLIRQLGNIDGLQVKSPTSSFQLRGTPLNLADVATRLRVNLVVEGDAHFSGRTLTVHARLVPVAGGRRLWTDTLRREVGSAGDLTDVVAELTRTIVNSLRLNLGPTARRYDPGFSTFQKYLRASTLREGGGWRAREATALFEEVIREDPSFAPAQAALASTYGALAMLYPSANLSISSPTAGDYSIPPGQAVVLMEPLAMKALEIDPMLAEAHSALGFTRALQHRWADAETSFRRAIALDPTIAGVFGDFVSSTLQPWGRLDEAEDLLEAALQADPLSLDLRRHLGHVQLRAGRFDDALRNSQLVVDRDPDFPFAQVHCIRALIAMGRTDEALDRINQHPHLNFISYFQAFTGRRREAEAAAAGFQNFPIRQAWIYAALGEVDRAFDALERLAADNPVRAATVLIDPEFAPARGGDPRADAFRRRMGFPK